MGFLSVVLSSIIYWAKKNQNCRQPNISSGQIYWVISYHQYISRRRYAGQGENYKEEYKMSETCWANFDELEETTASLFQKKIHEREKKAQNLWLMRITVSEVLIMAKNISMVQTKTCPLIYFQTKQKKWRIEARWTIKVVSGIKLQIIGCFRKRQTWKQNKGEQKTLTNVVWDPRRNGWLKTVENDLKRLRKMTQQS